MKINALYEVTVDLIIALITWSFENKSYRMNGFNNPPTAHSDIEFIIQGIWCLSLIITLLSWQGFIESIFNSKIESLQISTDWSYNSLCFLDLDHESLRCSDLSSVDQYVDYSIRIRTFPAPGTSGKSLWKGQGWF